jgi:hypothetical protein
MAKKKRPLRANPSLWERAKREALKKHSGVHSPQSMMEAKRIYENRGGGYLEKKKLQARAVE